MRMGGKWVIIWGYWVGFKAEEKGALCGSKPELVKWGGGGVIPLPVKPAWKSANVSSVRGNADGWIASLRGLRA